MAVQVNGGLIAQTADQFTGVRYCSGGAFRRGCTDCSGWDNGIIGAKLGMAIPGIAAGKFDGTEHGPVVEDWWNWNGCEKITRQEVSAGDIPIWPGVGNNGHMGIALDNGNMISCLNPSMGTRETPIAPNIGPTTDLHFLRLKNMAGGGDVTITGAVPAGCLIATITILRRG